MSAPAGLVKEGQWMLIHGVAGGTCQWAAQIAKIAGYKVIGTCPRGKLEVAESLGCDEVSKRTSERSEERNEERRDNNYCSSLSDHFRTPRRGHPEAN